jgi:hypothetical protein
MKLKTAVLAALAGTAAIAAPAFADNGWHGERHERFDRGHERFERFHYAPWRVVVAPAPRVIYAPAPYYYTPAPVYYRPAPVYPVTPGVSISFRLPL